MVICFLISLHLQVIHGHNQGEKNSHLKTMNKIYEQHCKLMRLDRGLPKIRSKSYSNHVLIDIFDPNLFLKSIEIVATIRNLGPNLNLTLNLYQKSTIISKIHRFLSQI